VRPVNQHAITVLALCLKRLDAQSMYERFLSTVKSGRQTFQTKEPSTLAQSAKLLTCVRDRHSSNRSDSTNYRHSFGSFPSVRPRRCPDDTLNSATATSFQYIVHYHPHIRHHTTAVRNLFEYTDSFLT
jgi:hypothetical protein